jgi:hypothetical protein
MLANTLFYLFAFSFIAGFFAVLVLGHLLLAAAIWPRLLKAFEPHRDTAEGTGRRIHPFNWYGRLADSK